MNRRGGAYVLVLGCATMISVVGLGVAAASRSQIKSSSAARDWAKCAVLAESAGETAVARINTDADWRSSIGTDEHVVIDDGVDFGAFSLEDPVDGTLEKGEFDNVRVRALARVGQASRRFSFECAYRPPTTLDVLKYGLYASGSVSASNVTVSGAPLGASSLSVSNTLTANVRVGTLSNSGTIIGEVRTGETALATLRDSSLATLDSRAVTINFSSLNSGELRRCVLSAGVNPYGAASAAGLYVIRVPTLQTLRIREARISGTLIVELSLLSRLQIEGPLAWDAGAGEYPALVIKTIATANVNITGSKLTLDEQIHGVNFNPASAPYQGAGDTDTLDSYPSEIRGVIHALGVLPSITIGTNTTVVGAVICEGGVTINDAAKITHDPQLLIDPPAAYRTSAAGMSPVAGTWKAVVEP